MFPANPQYHYEKEVEPKVISSMPTTPEPVLARVDSIIAQHRETLGALMPILQGIQQELGWIPEAAMHRVAEALSMPPDKVYSVVSFYTLFSTKPKGKYVIRVCESAPCHVEGAAAIIAELEKQLNIKMGEVTPDRQFSLEFTSCVGICGVAPAIMVNDEVHGNLTPAMVSQVLSKYK
ncbi:MAG: NADH-quinone oxidoreductase subunit NuoE [Bacillota bacterium]